MFSFFLRVILIIAGLWIIRRFLGMLFGEPGKRSSSGAGKGVTSSGKMVRDPVCGMYMDPRLAVRLDDRKGSFYFCSDECRRKYRELR
jgi:YHS domain-containing protein